MRIRGFDCDFNLVNDFGTGEGDFRYSRILDRWSVAGTITTREERRVTANVRWRGVGRAETDTNKTASQASSDSSSAGAATRWPPAEWSSAARRW